MMGIAVTSNTARGQRRLGAPLLQSRFAWLADERGLAEARTHRKATEFLRKSWRDGAGAEIRSASRYSNHACILRQSHQLLVEIGWIVPGVCQRGARADQHQLGPRLHIALKPFTRSAFAPRRMRPRSTTSRPTIRASMNRATRVILLLMHIRPAKASVDAA